ncbi:MAG: Ig-like domain-containing protein, partial [Gemmatimonadaceae bacterium]
MNRMRIRGLTSPVAALCMVALFAAGCGELTGPVSPSTPANVTATLLSATSVKVSWTPSPQNDGVVSYSVYRNGTKVGESTTTTYTDTGLSPQQTYKYSIAANCTSGLISDQSAVTAESTVITIDVTPPTVISHQPPTGFLTVSPSATATVVFSEPMDPASISTTTFNLKVTSSGALIPGTVTFTAATRTAEFKPTGLLPNPENITATVTTGAKDLAGNGLAAPFAWGFRTRDDTPPTVLSTTPANGATVPPSVIFFITFSEAMDASTINATNIALKLTSSGAAVAGNVNYNTGNHIASFTPNQTLAQNTGYTLIISGSVKDSVGNQMGTPVTVAVTTADVTPPTVVSTVPADGATGVSPTAPISAKFSEPMEVGSINAATFTVTTTSGLTPVPGTVTYDNTSSTATFTPSSSLSSATSYTATITTGARDVSKNPLAANKVWTFTTADIVPPTVASVSPTNLATGVG